jgi:hypothetical protein
MTTIVPSHNTKPNNAVYGVNNNNSYNKLQENKPKSSFNLDEMVLDDLSDFEQD